MKADGGSHATDHAPYRWRQGATFHPERLVPRTETPSAGRTIIVGALQSEFAERPLKGLGAPIHIASLLATGARLARPRKVGAVSVEPLLDHPRRETQSLTPCGRFHRLEVDAGRRFPAQQSIDLIPEVVRQSLAERSFFYLPLPFLFPGLQLSIRPLLAGGPVSLHLTPKLLARVDLLSHQVGFLDGEEAGLGLSSHRPGQAVIRTMTGLGICGTAATRLTAFHVALGEGPAAHGLGLGQPSREFTHRAGDFQRVNHGSSLRL